jgi:GNAT superfamily N-acetyltransferase
MLREPHRDAFAQTPALALRRATLADVGRMGALIEASVRALQCDDYPPAHIDLALADIYGVDSTLIADGTYFVIEDGELLAACGGWGRRATLCGGDAYGDRCETLLDPLADAAKIRAFYVHPSRARRGLATRILVRCEHDAAVAGFRRAELGATLTGVRFYSARGYVAAGRADIDLPNGERLAVVRMERALPPAETR